MSSLADNGQLSTVNWLHTIPLFPLNTVLFPDAPLKLRIFEPRYVDMIGRCMRENTGFGVALILDGMEVGPARTAPVGTLARIVDFERLEDGLLGITARGDRRFRIEHVDSQADGLNMAQVQWLPQLSPVPVPEEYSFLVDGLRQALPRLAEVYGDIAVAYEDASWVGARVTEILPYTDEERQHSLELDDPIERLRYLKTRMED